MYKKDLKKLIELQRDAYQFRESMYTNAEWQLYENYWEGVYTIDASGNDLETQRLNVPTLVSDAQRQKATLTGGDPLVQITAIRSEDVAAARVLQEQLNQIIVQVNLMAQVDDAVQDAITLGTGLLYDGFGSQFGVYKDTPIKGFDESKTDKNEDRIEYHDDIYDNLPWTLRAHPSDILFPPGTVRIADAHGFWHRYVRHIDDVREDEKLNKKARNELKADTSIDYNATQVGEEEGKQATSVYRSDATDYVTLFDYYDLKTSRRITYNVSSNTVLADEIDEIMFRIDRLPLHTITFNKNSRKIWGTSDFKLLNDEAMEINDIRTQQMKLRRLQIVKGFYNKTMVEDESGDIEKAIKNMTSEETMALIGVNGDPKGFIESFSPVQPWDMLGQVALAKDEIEQFGLGIGPMQKGQLSGGRHTKYETQAAESHYDQSMAPRLKEVRNVIINIVKNWSELIFDFWVEPRMIATHDAGGNPIVVEFNGADLRIDARFTMSLDSMRTKTKNDRVEEANMVLSQCMPFTQPMGPNMPPPINANSLIRQYLTNIGINWNIEDLIGSPQQQSQPMPFDQFQQGFSPDPNQQPANQQAMNQAMGQNQQMQQMLEQMPQQGQGGQK